MAEKPNPYPSPQMQQQQYSYDPSGQHPSEAYRSSPTGPSMSQAPSLPPIHHLEGQEIQQQPQYVPVVMNGAPMQQHQPPYPPPSYQYQNGAMQQAMPSNGHANGQTGMMRFPIPPQSTLESRQMSGGRHKKEIKRRTKTGCLTCRKRRIKCDEGHPSCRNCQKSKRECLGYDPIFKQQPGPAPIQPAPGAAVAVSKNLTSSSGSTNPYAQAPQSYAPAVGAGYTVPPHHGSGFDSTYDYNTAIDPALAVADPLAMAQNSYTTTLQADRRVKPIYIDELFALNNTQPSYQHYDVPSPVSSEHRQAVTDFYNFHYGPGLDKVFETTWYMQHGLSHLMNNAVLSDFVAQCTDQFKTNDDSRKRALPSLESRLVWQLAIMPRSAYNSANGAQSSTHLHALLPRIDVVEKLLTGQFLETNRVPPQPSAPQQKEPNQNAIYNEQAFWHNLGKFVSLRDDKADASTLKDVNDTLSAMRGILGMLENRDVLYSLAIARHIGGRMAEFHPERRLVATTNDPNDDLNKLIVAHRFVETEDQRGTNQVIQRICGMSIRSWMLQKQ